MAPRSPGRWVGGLPWSRCTRPRRRRRPAMWWIPPAAGVCDRERR